ncbi:hypothetical protein FHX58_000089 [Paraburkholderia tropica]|jgi:hypothetical protein|nr:hypothetical protein [Paraburkholderia tropica]
MQNQANTSAVNHAPSRVASSLRTVAFSLLVDRALSA